MNTEGNKRHHSIWTGLAVYAIAGWAAVEILFVVRSRYDLPESLEAIVLGLFGAGFTATMLLVLLHKRGRRSPLIYSLQLLAVAVSCSVMALGIATWLQTSVDAGKKASVAVLPCEYQGDEEYAYLGQGLAYDMHTRLGYQSEFRVPSWRAVLSTYDADPSPESASRELEVEHIATCRVLRTGKRTIIEARVLHPPDATPLLEQRIELASADLVSAVTDLAVAFVDQIAPRVDIADRVTRPPTANPQAYELYLEAQMPGWYPTEYGGFAAAKKASQQMLTRAIELDPKFADAYSLLASDQWVSFINSSSADRFEYANAAQENVLKALALDDCNARAWATGAVLRGRGSGEWRTFIDSIDKESMLRRSIECDPNHFLGWLFLGRHYSVGGLQPKTDDEFFHIVNSRREALTRTIELSPGGCPLVAEYYQELIPSNTNLAAPFRRLSAEEQLDYERNPVGWRARKTKVVQTQTQEGLARLGNMLIFNEFCRKAYSLIAGYSAGPAARRLDSAIAWELKSEQLDPGWNQMLKIAYFYNDLGLWEQGANWGKRAAEDQAWQTDALVIARHAQGDSAPALDRTRRYVEAQGNTDAPEAIKAVYRHAAWFVLWIRDFELALSYLEQGMAKLGISDPVLMLPARYDGYRQFMALNLALVYQRVGQPNRAATLLAESRKVDPIIARLTDEYESTQYIDAIYEALSENPGEALRLTRHAVENWQTAGGKLFPGIATLLLDPALDSVRENPLYGPQLRALIDDLNAVLEPMRDRVLEAEISGNWETLRTY